MYLLDNLISSEQFQTHYGRRSQKPNHNIFQNNFKRNVTNEHLLEIFSIYGPVATAEIEKDPRVGLSKGSAYVTFKKSKDMNQAMLHLDGAQLDGNVIKATFVLVANKRRREPSLGNLQWKCFCALKF